MATKVEKKAVRKQRMAEEMGLDYEQLKKDKKQTEKKGFIGLMKQSENRWKWFLFLIEILLLMVIFSFV